MNLKVTMVGDKEVARALKKLGANLAGRKLLSAVVSGAAILRNQAKLLAPIKSGTLRRSIHIGDHTDLNPDWNPSEHDPPYSDIHGEIKTPDLAQVEVGTNLIYAPIQEFGGTIHAKNAPYLVFKTKDGAWHSVKSVQLHPAAYMRGAYWMTKNQVIKEIDDALDVMIRDAFK